MSSCIGRLRDLHPFPTRRSSDLGRAGRRQVMRDVRGGALARIAGGRSIAVGGSIDLTRRVQSTRMRVGADALHHVAYQDRKSTRLNSSHLGMSYAVFCLIKQNSE